MGARCARDSRRWTPCCRRRCRRRRTVVWKLDFSIVLSVFLRCDESMNCSGQSEPRSWLKCGGRRAEERGRRRSGGRRPRVQRRLPEPLQLSFKLRKDSIQSPSTMAELAALVFCQEAQAHTDSPRYSVNQHTVYNRRDPRSTDICLRFTFIVVDTDATFEHPLCQATDEALHEKTTLIRLYHQMTRQINIKLTHFRLGAKSALGGSAPEPTCRKSCCTLHRCVRPSSAP